MKYGMLLRCFSVQEKNPGLLLESIGKLNPSFPLGTMNGYDLSGISSFCLRVFCRGLTLLEDNSVERYNALLKVFPL